MGPGEGANEPAKHGISLEEAAHVFDDPFALFEQDRTDVETGEQRWQAIGLVQRTIVLLVAHAVREEGEDEIIRLISARRATRKERACYEQNRAQELG